MKKKYTIIYMQPFNIGSQRHFLTKYAHVETDDLATTIKEDVYEGNVLYVFDGWATETTD